MSYSVMIENLLIKMDKICDYIPILSAVSNLVDIAVKGFIQFLPETSVQSSHYLTYLSDKKGRYCAVLAVPVIGSIFSKTFHASIDQKRAWMCKGLLEPLLPDGSSDDELFSTTSENSSEI